MFEFIHLNDEIFAIPKDLISGLLKLQSSLYLKKAGVKIGTIKHNELIPHHELALSTILSPAVPFADVDLEVALDYLRRRDINMTTNNKGWLIIKYNDLPLGWVKNLGSRVNNYYPKEWRILNK